MEEEDGDECPSVDVVQRRFSFTGKGACLLSALEHRACISCWQLACVCNFQRRATRQVQVRVRAQAQEGT